MKCSSSLSISNDHENSSITVSRISVSQQDRFGGVKDFFVNAHNSSQSLSGSGSQTFIILSKK